MTSAGFAFLLIDVDGYCAGGVDQRTIVSAHQDGYRARELGWAFYGDARSGAGSIYFRDLHAPPLQHSDPGVQYVKHLHGLPISPGVETYPGEIVACSSRLLEVIRVLYEAIAAVSQQPVVIVHKGGNEGFWAAQAIAGASIIDLGTCGCPKVDDIGRGAPEHCVGKHCPHHKATKRRAGKIIHCPQLEVKLLALWIAGRESDPMAPERQLRPHVDPEEQY